jgi:NAD+ synthase (glutamine-hydrolysing)
VNGQAVAQGSQFSLGDVETVVATVDLEDVRSYRFSKSRAIQATQQLPYERIEIPIGLSSDDSDVDPLLRPSIPREVRYHSTFDAINRRSQILESCLRSHLESSAPMLPVYPFHHILTLI